MEVNIKRLSLLFFIVLVALLLVACGIFDPQELKNEDYFPTVEFSEAGTTVIIYLDGQTPISANNRVLTKSIAVLGHDLFEAKVISTVGAPVYQYPLLH